MHLAAESVGAAATIYVVGNIGLMEDELGLVINWKCVQCAPRARAVRRSRLNSEKLNPKYVCIYTQRLYGYV